ncbi:hypothetical protein BBJ28_00000319 [Nothophytophthora sp. Chile5]|nr:hypothetical protein BBJ28_00000319 [Nothophytophthora sp. Chile5]
MPFAARRKLDAAIRWKEAPSSPRPNASQRPPRKMEDPALCRFFQSPQGCFRGESCTFRHERKSSSDRSAKQQQDAAAPSASNPYASGARTSGPRLCRFYSAGAGCRNGSACPFAHVDPNDSGNGAGAGAGGLAYSGMEEAPPPPLPQEGMEYTALAVTSGGAVFYNHPGLPPPMMLVMPEQQLPTDAGSEETAAAMEATTPRRRLKIQANPQKKETISEILPVLTRDIEGPVRRQRDVLLLLCCSYRRGSCDDANELFAGELLQFFAIDVECVATGSGTNDRDVARIAMVDEDEQVVFDQYVQPSKPIVSYLTQLTGITERDLEGAPNLAEALTQLKAILPVESVIVGQSIKKDLDWLTLQKPTDYKQEFDVADLFRLPMQATNGVVRYRYFSLRHVAKYLLGNDIQEADHDPVIDARYAMKVFKQFRYLHESPGHRDAVLQTLLKTPRTPSFADRYPVIDGVSMRAPRKPGTSPSIRNANRVAAAHAQQASGTRGGYNLHYPQQQQGQQLYL